MISYTEHDIRRDRAADAADGVSFSVTVRGTVRRCLVTRDALLYISPTEPETADCLLLFRRHEFRIYRLARMLVGMGIKGTPLILGPWTFRIDSLTNKTRLPGR